MSTDPGSASPAEQLRQQRRAWISTHHPDRGGDPAIFRAGLARLDAEADALARTDPRTPTATTAAPHGPGPVGVYRSRNPLRRARRWLRRRRAPRRHLQ